MKFVAIASLFSVALSQVTLDPAVISAVSASYPKFETSMNEYIRDMEECDAEAYSELTSKYGNTVVPTTYAASDITKFFAAVPTKYDFLKAGPAEASASSAASATSTASSTSPTNASSSSSRSSSSQSSSSSSSSTSSGASSFVKASISGVSVLAIIAAMI
ncbi:hypothetical protein AYI69_g11223 [Smittium culicis]|uniref:Uncharacterized protein n=1 Tax=Smittium culicis TaxID=133412 RepID=A0A1R1X076_9FUNG|nr:hypothetical protein AYI69_g11223 [Smittium culicis]